MELVELSELFDVRYGHSLELNALEQTACNGVAFVSRQMMNNGVSSFVRPIEGVKPAPAGDISCALGGNGVLTTCLQSSEFYCGRDVAILRRKSGLSEKEVLIYCHYIKSNRFRYSYGRQANRTLKAIKIPSRKTVEAIANKITFPEQPSKLPKKNQVLTLSDREWKSFKVEDLFILKPTLGKTTNDLILGTEIPYIAAKKSGNGLSDMCARNGNGQFITEGNKIVFIQLGQGSSGYSLYQGDNFIGMSGKTSVGYNEHLNPFVGMFLVTILDKERPKYSFGRSWTGNRLKRTKIKLPADHMGEPDWQFMEDYIKSLPYSANLENMNDQQNHQRQTGKFPLSTL